MCMGYKGLVLESRHSRAEVCEAHGKKGKKNREKYRKERTRKEKKSKNVYLPEYAAKWQSRS